MCWVIGPLVFLIFGVKTATFTNHFPVSAALILPSEMGCLKRNNTEAYKCNYQLNLENSAPALSLAAKDVARRFGWPEDWINFNNYDHQDNEDQMIAVHRAIEAATDNNTVSFGPVCEYIVASTVRVFSYHNIPIITPGGQTESFRDKTVYSELTTLGARQDLMINLIQRMAQQFNWNKIRYFYQKEFWKSEVLDSHWCRLFGSSMLDREQMNTSYVPHTKASVIEENGVSMLAEKVLVDDVGYQYGASMELQYMTARQNR